MEERNTTKKRRNKRKRKRETAVPKDGGKGDIKIKQKHGQEGYKEGRERRKT